MKKILIVIMMTMFALSANAKEYTKNTMIVDGFKITNGVGSIKVAKIGDLKGGWLILGHSMKKEKAYKSWKKNMPSAITIEKSEGLVKLLINGNQVLNFNIKYIKKHRATFVQAFDNNNQAFAIWIKIAGGKPSIALNVEEFQTKINKAIEREIPKLAAELQVTEDKVREVIKAKKEGEAVSDAINSAIDDAVDNSVSDTVESTASYAINNAIDAAIASGISQAALDAGIAAGQAVLDAGGTEAEAIAAGQEAAGL